MSSRSDIGVKPGPKDRRPSSPLVSDPGIRPSAESYLHFRSHSRSSSIQSGSEATPTPSASALRRAQALAGLGNLTSSPGLSGSTSDTAATSSGSKLSNLLQTLQPSSRLGSSSGHLTQHHSSRSHSRSESGIPASASASPLPSHSKLMNASGTATSVRAPYGGPGGTGSYSPSPSMTASSATLVSSSTVADKDNPWGALHVHVLPLFNREPLRIPIEDLNSLVRRHIRAVLSRHPGKVIAQLEADLTELITTGMLTLNSKLANSVDEEKLLSRVVELWGFFWDQVLPYVEGVFLPLQTEPYLQSLSRTPKAVRAPSPTQSDITSSTNTNFVVQSIDVRTLALRSFRDSVVVPIASRLQKRLSNPAKDHNSTPELNEHQRPRLEQMLLVLSSIAANTVSLATNSSSQTPSERAITTLLRLLLYPPGSHPTTIGAPATTSNYSTTNPNTGPSFLSGSAPRDRRGRVARRSLLLKSKASHSTGDSDGLGLGFGYGNENENDGASMTGGAGGVGGAERAGDERDNEREFFESLRSPNLDPDVDETPAGIGGPPSGDPGNPNGGIGSGEDGSSTMSANNGLGVESLGTGPGGWGPPADGGTIGTISTMGTVSGKRTAIYDSSGAGRLREELDEDDDLVGMGDLTYPGGNIASGTTSGVSTRRPSRV